MAQAEFATPADTTPKISQDMQPHSEKQLKHPHPGPADQGADRLRRANWRGLWTLYLKEVRRFYAVFSQTIIAPLITTLLFLAVFTLALGRSAHEVWGVPFSEFIAPGLIMMAVTQNAFANTSSSLVIAKIQGNIVDVLMPPLSPFELTVGYTLGGMTRGLVVGTAVALVMIPLLGLSIASPFLLLFHALSAAMMLALLGILGGIWAEKFDHIAAVTNFVITPLAFLSGTFYSVQRLPGIWYDLAHFNPFFYAIDGFRYGFLGQSDTRPWIGICVMLSVNLVLWISAQKLFTSGYRLKS